MNIIFFGASTFGYECCKFIIENNLADIKAIFTIPENFQISYSDKPVKNYLYKDFNLLGNEYHIPVISVNSKMETYVNEIKKFEPDFILVIGWYYIIPKIIRDIPSLGIAGVHASLLPKYRGGAPLVWALINGERKTGVTLFYFDKGVDTGDIIAQSEFLIAENETIKDVLIKAQHTTLIILKEYLPQIASGIAPRKKQNEIEATYFPQRKPEDGLIDWECEPSKIKNFIRAQTKPYPGAFTIVGNKKVILWDADIFDIET